MNIRNVTVVVRSVGERTKELCRELLAQQVPEENIVTVTNVAPLSAMLTECFRVGIERNLPWTLCYDADVLVAPGTVGQILDAADEVDETVFELQGRVLDKLFGIRRPAGNHLYRTSLLGKALDVIPREGQAIRAEHFTQCRMADLGHPWVEIPLVLGLHDFHQYDRDVFRKCYIHARKFDELMRYLVEYWRGRAPQDGDYRVALGGLAAGIAHVGKVEVDVRRDRGFSKWALEEKWTEKDILKAGEITSTDIEQTMAAWQPPGEELAKYEACGSRVIIHRGGVVESASPTKQRDPRLLRKFPSAMGRMFGKVGRRLERLST